MSPLTNHYRPTIKKEPPKTAPETTCDLAAGRKDPAPDGLKKFGPAYLYVTSISIIADDDAYM